MNAFRACRVGSLSVLSLLTRSSSKQGGTTGYILKDQARPDICSGRAFCLYSELQERNER